MIVVTSAWAGDGKSTQTAFRPAVADDHPGVSFPFGIYGDAVNGPATHLAVCDAATLSAIQSDAKYAGKVAIPSTQAVADLQAKIAAQKTDPTQAGAMAKAMIALGLTVSPELQAAANAVPAVKANP